MSDPNSAPLSLLESLPFSAFLRVAFYLSPKDISHLSCASRRLRDYSNRPVVWAQLLSVQGLPSVPGDFRFLPNVQRYNCTLLSSQSVCPYRLSYICQVRPFPQDVGVSKESTPNYGGLSVGDRIVIHHHRPVAGRDNWRQDMDTLDGKEARVCQLAGVDSQGCPGVRCIISGSRHPAFLRIRDLTLPASAIIPAGSSPIVVRNCPQDWGLSGKEIIPRGFLRRGSRVILGTPMPVPDDGEGATSDTLMLAYPSWRSIAGHTCRIVRFLGCDKEGCPLATIRRDGTSTTASVRIRDLHNLDDPRYPLCQDTGMRSSQVSYGYLRVGSKVRVHKHRPVNGEMNWGSAMDKYVDKIGIVKQLRGVDKQGCAVVGCKFDGKDTTFAFRVRDMDLIEF